MRRPRRETGERIRKREVDRATEIRTKKQMELQAELWSKVDQFNSPTNRSHHQTEPSTNVFIQGESSFLPPLKS